MYPGHLKLVQEAFKEATSVPYGYLLVDLKQDTPEDMRLRTTIFPDDGVQYMYLPKVYKYRVRGSSLHSHHVWPFEETHFVYTGSEQIQEHQTEKTHHR